MITQIIEGSDGALYGKWLVSQLSETERDRKTELPGFEGSRSVWTFGGARKLGAHPNALLVVDLQTDQGAVFIPGGLSDADLDTVGIWVCPLFRSFLHWLYEQDTSDVAQLPPFIELSPRKVADASAG